MITYILNHTHEDGFNTFGISAFCGKKLIKSVSGISESFREMTELRALLFGYKIYSRLILPIPK